MAEGATDFMTAEFQRLQDERATLEAQIQAIDSELVGIKAFFEARSLPLPTKGKARGGGTRRSGVRKDILTFIEQHPEGVKRAQILEGVGVKGNKQGESSASNALSALKKAGKIRHSEEDGVFRPAAGTPKPTGT